MMKRTISPWCIPGLLLFLGIGLMPGSSFGQDTTAVAPQADRLLQQMGAYLAEAETMAFRARVTTDEVMPTGQTVQFGRTMDLLVRRPNGIRAIVNGDRFQKRFWYDGQRLTLYDVPDNVYATTEAPGDIDAALDFAMEQLGVTFALADFVYRDPYATLIEHVESGFYVGLHRVDGIRTHHLAFSQEGIDWQIWIEDGPHLVPRKFVITYKDLPGSPQFTAVLSDWNLDVRLPDVLFEFEPPFGATLIEFLPVTAGQ